MYIYIYRIKPTGLIGVSTQVALYVPSQTPNHIDPATFRYTPTPKSLENPDPFKVSNLT